MTAEQLVEQQMEMNSHILQELQVINNKLDATLKTIQITRPISGSQHEILTITKLVYLPSGIYIEVK